MDNLDNHSFTPDPALSGAVDECIEKLSQDDKAAFQSAGDIMRKIQEMEEANSGDASTRTLRTRIGAVLQLIKRFTAAVAPCIQYSPHVSLAVGGFNCVLLVRSAITNICAVVTKARPIICTSYSLCWDTSSFLKTLRA